MTRAPLAPEPPASEEGPSPARLLGARLREAREGAGRRIEDYADALRIRPAYLACLEDGRLDALPGRVYAAGFMRAYAGALGLDGDAMAAGLRESPGSSPHGPVRPSPAFPRLADPVPEGGAPRASFLLASFALLGLAYLGWHHLVGRPAGDAPEAVALEPSEAPSLDFDPTFAAAADRPAAMTSLDPLGLPVPTPPPSAAPAVLVPAPPPFVSPRPMVARVEASPTAPADVRPDPMAAEAATSADGVVTPDGGAEALPAGRIVLEAREDSWVRVRVAYGDTLLTRTLRAGERQVLPDRVDLALWTGNAGGLVLRVDGRALPPLGRSGAVMRDVPLDPDRLLARAAGAP